MWTACILAAVGTPFCIVKLVMFHYARNPLPAVALLSANMGFTVRSCRLLARAFVPLIEHVTDVFTFATSLHKFCMPTCHRLVAYSCFAVASDDCSCTLKKAYVLQAMHIIAAQNVVRWARKRYDMGLGGFGYPWEESEEAWLVAGSRASRGCLEDTDPALRSTDDVPPAALADPDSRFIECAGLTVHYKEACISTVRYNAPC